MIVGVNGQADRCCPVQVLTSVQAPELDTSFLRKTRPTLVIRYAIPGCDGAKAIDLMISPVLRAMVSLVHVGAAESAAAVRLRVDGSRAPQRMTPDVGRGSTPIEVTVKFPQSMSKLAPEIALGQRRRCSFVAMT